jgi:hypothetical protein
MFKEWEAEEIAWLISTLYAGAIKDDRVEAVRVFHAIMAALKEGK